MATVTFGGNFEWEEEKAASNLVKHGVSFEEASTVLEGSYVVEPDGQGCFIAIGFSAGARILTVVHVDRGTRDRIISAWVASATEQRKYAEG